MSKQFSIILWFIMPIVVLLVQAGYAKNYCNNIALTGQYPPPGKSVPVADSASVRVAAINIINTVIKASSTFNIDDVANLYTPNAVIVDEEPPFSWNGPTAGVQWINAVEKTCKGYKLKEFKAKTEQINIYLQNEENIYVVVPVDYTWLIKGDRFEEEGAFTFILRIVNGRWMIKSQVWTARKGL